MDAVYVAIEALLYSKKKRHGVCPRRVEELRIELEKGAEIYPIRINALGDGRYVIKDGRHRFQAHLAAGLTEILAFIENTTERITIILRNLLSHLLRSPNWGSFLFIQ